MRAGGYSSYAAYGGRDFGIDKVQSYASVHREHTTSPRGTSPGPVLYGRSGSPTMPHQGSPLKERPTFGRPTVTEQPRFPHSRLGENDRYVFNPGSYKSTLGGSAYTTAPSYGLPTQSTPQYLNTTPTKQRPRQTLTTNFISGLPSTPQAQIRYGSPVGSPVGSPTTPSRQRIRGTSFRDDYSGVGYATRRMRRAPSMIGTPGTMMVPAQAPEDAGKYTVVLDLDETLIFARDGPLYARPGVDDLLKMLGRDCEAIAWTAGLRAYAQAVLLNIDKTQAIKHCIYRHGKWFSGQAGYQKDLGLLGRSMDRTIIIENTPDCIRGNRENGVLVADYEGGEQPDETIPRLNEFIRGLVSSGQTVPQYLATCPMLSRKQVSTDKGDFIECYWLEVNTPATPTSRSPRFNRDLPVTFDRFGSR